MNPSKDRLKDLCRLCGKPIKPSPTLYSKHDYARDIRLTLDGLDVSKDTEIHPTFLDDSCRLKLTRFRKKKNKHSKSTVNITLCDWEAYHRNQPPVAPSVIDTAATEGEKFGLLNWAQDEILILVKLQTGGHGVERCLKINKDFTWNFHVWNQQQCSAPCLSTAPKVLDHDSVKDLVRLVATHHVCVGLTGFDELAKKKGVFKGKHHQVVGTTRSYVSKDGSTKLAVHRNGCHGLSTKPICEVCTMYRSSLCTMEKRRLEGDNQPADIHSRARNDYLGSRVNEKVDELQRRRRQLEIQVLGLKETVAALIQRDGVVVSSEEEERLKGVLHDVQDEIERNLKPDTPHQLLWQQQLEALSKKDKRQMRWHPAVLRWCIAVFCKSSSAYNLMRKTQFMVLPHETTLKKYMQFTVPKPGIMPEVLKHILDDWKIPEDAEFARNVTLIFDEMQIRSGLVYSKATGKLLGFTDTGPISNELENFDRRLEGVREESVSTCKTQLANQMLVLMVRGIFSPMRVPVAYYPTRSAASHTLYHCIWPIVKTLTLMGLIVRAFVSDGASWNRKFYNHHRMAEESGCITYSTRHPLLRREKLYFICDVPHLLKTTRNNWENSGSHQKSRNLLVSIKSLMVI